MPQLSELESIVPLVKTLHRRQLLSLGLRLGLASPVIARLMAAAPETTVAQEATPSSEAP